MNSLEIDGLNNIVKAVNECLRRQESLMERVEQNIRKLDEAVKLMRGVEAQVRPHARKNDWYKEEIQTKPVNESSVESIELLPPHCN